ncbi:MAG TPA: ComEC/Rec2 family competence protein [Chloroflexota bacterium]|nr:ComEC/Rec2 family competence protein [Chloroflexota bacterium]
MTLVWLAAAFILGIFAGWSVVVAGAPLLVGVAVLFIVGLVVWRRPKVRLPVLMAMFLLLGAGRSEMARVHIGPHDVGFFNGQAVTLTGYVNTEPDVRDTGNNYVIAVDDLLVGTRKDVLGGQVELHTAPGQVLDEGDEIQFTGILTVPVNSSALPYRSILANRGIYSQMSFPKLFVTGHVSLGLVGLAAEARQWIENSISGALPEPEATMLIAILVGARSAQLGTLAPILIQTGLIHLIAVSGIKIAIVAGTVNTSLRRLVSRSPTLLFSVLALGSYWMVSGATVAGLRASIMWLLIFIAAYLGRPTFALVSLGLAAAVMLAISPSLMWDTGFQLTIMATASIAAFSPLLERVTRRVPAALAASLTTTFAAQLGVLPIQIVSFHIVSPVSLLANAIVLPFIPLTMVVGFAAAVIQAPVLDSVAFALVHLLILIAHWAAGLGAVAKLTSVPIPISLAYYGVLLLVALAAWRVGSAERLALRGEWLVGLSVAAVGLGIAMASPLPRDQISFITTGDLLLTSHGQHVLIDGGTSGAQLLTGLGDKLPYPNGHLDAIIDTSPNSKNVAALLEVAQHVRVGQVVDPGIEYPSQTYGRWRDWLASHGIPVLTLRRGIILHGADFSIEALALDGLYSNPKDGAGILVIRFGGKRVLYIGNASLKEQQDLPFQTSVRADAAISAVPIDATLRRAAGFHEVIAPDAGEYILLHR